MVTEILQNFATRKNFAKIKTKLQTPSLIDIQRKSYNKFLQMDTAWNVRENSGLQSVFQSVFPIKDYNETASLEFVGYHFDRPKYDVEECRSRGMTFAAPIRVVVRLVIWDKDESSGNQTIRDVKEQEVYFGEVPLMTDFGTFIVNGTERVVVSQLHRSPGVFFDSDRGRTHSSGKLLYNARIIPYRGSWLDFEFDHKDLIYCRIDRRRKFLATIVLKALGYSTEELLSYFYKTEVLLLNRGNGFSKVADYDLLLGQRATKDIVHPESDEVLVRKNRKFTKLSVQKMQEANIQSLQLEDDEVSGLISAKDVIDVQSGEVILECNEALTLKKLESLVESGLEQIQVLFIDGLNVGSYLRDTIAQDKVSNREEALLELYRRMRPGDPPTLETAENLFTNLFFNPERYDLSEVGRLKFNHKFNLDEPLTNRVLTKRDILETVRYLIELRNGTGSLDDIDHLGNRRVRAVGELIENQYRIGLVRMERAIKERMSVQEVDTLMPHDLVNNKPVAAVVKEFFGSSQLSQFMDQTNPLSEITHKRRLSALGPGGLTRERAGFEVRDVHTTHYGRICPIETPEGQNIGLIASLSTFARVNEYGFVETPYRRVRNGQVTDEIEYFSALQEENEVIAQANSKVDPDTGAFLDSFVQVRKSGETTLERPEEISLMDVSPNQLVSVAAGLIPFLEHDDANRALMGSNMQRQAVPLLRSDSPLVGTGMEAVVARDSGVCRVAKRGGVIDYVDSSRIVVRVNSDEIDDHGSQVDIYKLNKFQRSNQSTCFNQKPIVSIGNAIQAGDVIADGPSTDCGELALGRNVVVAFMPWHGYNFEDSILISERLLKEDLYTSIHIEEYECVARDTKLGPEEITRDIPNAGDETLGDLDEAGIIRVGAEVKAGDILVGKITPKGESQLSPEEKLLRAIFGEKAGDVRDTSLRMPPGTTGTVIDAKVFTRKGIDKDSRARSNEEEGEAQLLKDQNDEIRIIRNSAVERMVALLKDRVTINKLIDEKGKVLIKKGDELTSELLSSVDWKYYGDISVSDTVISDRIQKIVKTLTEQIEAVRTSFSERIKRLKEGDELPPGVIKIAKVYVAVKRKLQPGDKMAGRHGNKGVISRVLPEEDMPYLPDGTPVDFVLNPLGVPSRMNVGQILETHLGWAAKGLGEKLEQMLHEQRDLALIRNEIKEIFGDASHEALVERLPDTELPKLVEKLKRGISMQTPVFDGAPEEKIRELLELGNRNVTGQTILFDGRTGEPFDQDVTVGVMYMLKLHHLVDDKIHARSIGPYSLVTQQPLGGKAQFGGQRLGEMEVWAMEAYGAAYSLQEFLTVKSDDVIGRTRMYEAIVKGEHVLESGIPESFNVLIKELQSLALDVQLLDEMDPTKA
ncbi:MAG: DNA-directed RNA polymerase subunit beta [Myxococcaceae bacterium]|nr:DNA-directed RNA polymerase subunit beta [Myxococcaceae bacterium]MBH2006185.1 DNA-directed RNA polymerase subunit beta [Myxococcaceae bacterium]